MPVEVVLPSALRALAGGQSRVAVDGTTVREVLDNLESKFPGIDARIRDAQDGSIRRFVNVFVNGEDVRFNGGVDAAVPAGAEVGILPSMAGGAAAAPAAFTEEQVVRYSRHLIMPEVGRRGQLKLMQAKVLLIGAGGLGSPTGLYLGAAGVGTLGIVDFDTVDLTNLQRQLFHHGHDIGRSKVDSATDALADINPNVKVIPHKVALTSENAREIIDQYDVIVNGCDNFATRYLASDVSYWAGKPMVDGSILRFDGQATVFVPGKGCYRCLFPTPPPPGEAPSCAEAGVLGVLPGIIGCIQAIETVKLILGIGESLAGRLMLFDALDMEFRTMKIRRDPECPVCGDHPTITEPIDYDQFCGAPPLNGNVEH
jgi:adenylyltransferase/sulfurtransferase